MLTRANDRGESGETMDRRLVSGTVAGLAAVVLAAGGTTLGAFDDAADVPHSTLGAGVLQLDLHTGGSAGAALSFAGLMPGSRTSKAFWVAASDAASTVPATMSLTVHHLVDVPGRCDISRGKAEGERASGIAGCVITAESVSGTPRIGTASRLLDVRAHYVPTAGGSSRCRADADDSSTLLPVSGPGDLYTAARAHGGQGTTTPIVDDAGAPLVLLPGHGICVAVSAYWPPDVTDAAHASPDHPVDNAGQGDALTVGVRFDLTQVSR